MYALLLFTFVSISSDLRLSLRLRVAKSEIEENWFVCVNVLLLVSSARSLARGHCSHPL